MQRVCFDAGHRSYPPSLEMASDFEPGRDELVRQIG